MNNNRCCKLVGLEAGHPHLSRRAVPAKVFAKLRPGSSVDESDPGLGIALVHHELRRRRLVDELDTAAELLSHTEEAEARSRTAFTNVASLPEYAALEEQIARGEPRAHAGGGRPTVTSRRRVERHASDDPHASAAPSLFFSHQASSASSAASSRL